MQVASEKLAELVQNSIDEHSRLLIDVSRHIHSHPELPHMVFKMPHMHLGPSIHANIPKHWMREGG